MAARTFRKKKTTKKASFFDDIFAGSTWITEKELERVIENKRDEFCRKKNMNIQSGGETMRHASGQKSEHEHRIQNIG